MRWLHNPQGAVKFTLVSAFACVCTRICACICTTAATTVSAIITILTMSGIARTLTPNTIR